MTTRDLKHGQICGIAAAGLVLGTLAQPAAAANIGACQTISQPGTYTLVNNLTAANGNCLLVAGSDITIDLNGFTITANPPGAAILNAPRLVLRAITVRNGYIVGGGIGLGNTDGAVIEDMDVSGNAGGITLLRGRVERNHVHDGANGGIEGFEAITAIDNIVVNKQGNGLVSGPGSQIEGNLVGQDGNGILNAGNANGTVFVADAIFRDNVAFRNRGLDFGVSCPAILERNVVASPTPNVSVTGGGCIGSPNQPNFNGTTSSSGAIRVGQSKGEHR